MRSKVFTKCILTVSCSAALLCFSLQALAAVSEELVSIEHAIELGKTGPAQKKIADLRHTIDRNDKDTVAALDGLEGLSNLYQNKLIAAVNLFKRATEQAPQKASLWYYLAQTLVALDDPRYLKLTEKAFQQAEKLKVSVPGYWVLLSRWQLQRKNDAAAFRTLTEGSGRFPKELILQKEKVALFVRLELFYQAESVVIDLQNKLPDDPFPYLALAEIYRHTNRLEEQTLLLEKAHLLFPQNADFISELAYTYAVQGKPLSAATLLDRLSLKDPKYAVDAAQLYRHAQKNYASEHTSLRITSLKHRLKQQLLLFIALKRWDRAIALQLQLERSSPLTDEERNLLARAHYARQEYRAVLELLKNSQSFAARQIAAKAQKCLENQIACR